MLISSIAVYKRSLVIILIGMAGHVLAHNSSHGPFSDDAQVERIALLKLVRVSENPDLDCFEPEAVFEHSDQGNMQLIVTRCEEGRFARLVADGETILPQTHFSNSLFYAGLMAYSADLNRDGILDFIIYSNFGGCGLASGYCDVAFILSHDRKYTLASVFTMFPGGNDFVILENKPCFIHTSFGGVEKCNDGKNHNFWIYNLLVFEKGGLKIDNSEHDAFPKTIWFSYKPNHAETAIISEAQKAELQKQSMEELCISESTAVEWDVAENLAGGKAVSREMAREKIWAMPQIKASVKAVLENGGLGVEIYIDEQPEEHLGAEYWEVHVYGNYHDHHTRLVTFLVGTTGEETLILNFLDVGPRYKTLKEWMGTR